MSTVPRLQMAGTVMSTRDVHALAGFYERLLGWTRSVDEADWVVIGDDPARPALCFHTDVEYVAPAWPSSPHAQQMMVHVDFAVDDVRAATAHAVRCGARHAAAADDDDISVLLDPDGHPFCLLRAPSWFQP